MDSCEAARAVFARVQTIDPEHAHKIVGYILLQDQAEKEMIRLAFGPESHIHSVIAKAKNELRISSNSSCASGSSPPPPTFSPISSPISISRPNPQPLSKACPPQLQPIFSFFPLVSFGFSRLNNPLSYAAVLNGTAIANGSFAPSLTSPRLSLNPEILAEDHHLQASPLLL